MGLISSPVFQVRDIWILVGWFRFNAVDVVQPSTDFRVNVPWCESIANDRLRSHTPNDQRKVVALTFGVEARHVRVTVTDSGDEFE